MGIFTNFQIKAGTFISVDRDCDGGNGLTIPAHAKGVVTLDYGKALEVQFIGIEERQTINSLYAKPVSDRSSVDVYSDWLANLSNRLEGLHVGRWNLIGISVQHSGDVNVNDIEDFLKNAPFTIRQLLNIIRNK